MVLQEKHKGAQWVSAATLKGAFAVQNDSKRAQSGMAGLCVYVHMTPSSINFTPFNAESKGILGFFRIANGMPMASIKQRKG